VAVGVCDVAVSVMVDDDDDDDDDDVEEKENDNNRGNDDDDDDTPLMSTRALITEELLLIMALGIMRREMRTKLSLARPAKRQTPEELMLVLPTH
jgi:hypothetical protein